ncbi:MAG: FMN-binding protein [Acidobacteriota bacterium]
MVNRLDRAGSSGLISFALMATLAAGSLPSRREALEAIYPGAQIRAERIFLTEAQIQEAAARAGEPIASPLIALYTAYRGERVVGRAYVDTHTVRTKKESLLICLDEQGRVKRVEVTAFLEPPEYLASAAWYAQYKGRTLTKELNLNRAIRPMAGATLTAKAASGAVRRVLAIDQALRGAALKKRK